MIPPSPHSDYPSRGVLMCPRGIRTTCQFNSKVFSNDPSKPHLWSSTPLSNIDFSADKTAFYADDCAMELSEDGMSYTIKSMTDQKSIVNLKITRSTPGLQAGTTGTSLFGTDLENPWGRMRHAFWPRCVTEGTITTSEGALDFTGQGLYVYALQGMKPHHAAARWNFADFQGPNYTAVMMEFTTPPSYGSTVVNVGAVVKDGEIIIAGAPQKATHTTVEEDPENEWPEPSDIKWEWTGTDKDGKPVEAVIECSMGTRTDKVDVMAEVPGFVKTIVASAAGTKPYIYQVRRKPSYPAKVLTLLTCLQFTPKSTLKIKTGDEEVSEEGQLFIEATFISQ